MRTRNWRYVLVVLSVAANVVFAFVLMIAYMTDEESASWSGLPGKSSSFSGHIDLPAGLLRFARIPTADLTDGMLPDSIVVMLGDCAIATFEFDGTYSRLTDSDLYDAQCRPRVSLDIDSGATIYSVYKGGDTDPEYSVSDENADGLGDRKINWVTKRSFKRSGKIKWRDVTRGKAK